MILRPAILRSAPAPLAAAALALMLCACSTIQAGKSDPDTTASTARAGESARTEVVATETRTEVTTQVRTEVAADGKAPRDGAAPPDDLALGKEHFRARHYGLAELHYRRAAEAAPGDAEAWLGLAAAYDQLKRYPLADRAYGTALKITGLTPEFLNNRGYSYLLRGDVRRASQDLSAAAAAAPDDERIQNNLNTLEARVRRRG